MLLLMACLAGAPLAGGGSPFPERVMAGPVELVKVGESEFRWALFRVYAGALYLDAARRDAHPLEDVAKRLELAYAVRLSPEDFRRSGDRLLERNVDRATWESLQERLARLNAAYRPVRRGDRYALTYIPGEGTTLALNGEPLVTIEGADFAAAYFSIWLGDTPAKAAFRRGLLGE